MSFRCEMCREPSEVYACPTKIVVATRAVPKPPPLQEHTRTEIVREMSLCDGCAGTHYPTHPDVIRRAVFREAAARAALKARTMGVETADHLLS
jgi:hypothetical protein